MELVDCHTHTLYSDGSSTLLQNALRAREMGITTLCCTDHLTLPVHMDPTCEVSVAQGDLQQHFPDYRAAASSFGDLDLVYGFECDYYPGCEPNIEAWKGSATYLLGSVHMLDGRWFDDLRDLSYWDETGTDAVWKRYFEVWCEACHSPARFDSMAHPDLVMLLGRFPAQGVDSLYDMAALAAHDAGVRVEINTAGLVKPVQSLYPAQGLLERFRRAGVPITVGSDAHAVSRIGHAIQEAYALAHSVGYRCVDVPTSQGGWRAVNL